MPEGGEPTRPVPTRGIIRIIPSRVKLHHRALFAHDFNDEALGALAVELGVEDLLPRAQVEHAFGDGEDDLLMDDDVLEVGVAIGFTGLVMAVVAVLGGEAFENSLWKPLAIALATAALIGLIGEGVRRLRTG